MHNMWLIAKREYLEQIKGRAFKATTIGLPAVFAAILGIGYLANLGIGANEHLVVASNDTSLAKEIQARLLLDKNGKATVDVVAATDADRAAMLEQVKTRSVDGLLWVNAAAGKLPTATYYSPSSGDFITTGRMKEALNDGLMKEHLTGAGMKQADVDAVVKGIEIDTYQVKKDGRVVASNAMASFWKGYVMAILLSMTTMIYGLNVARSIIQEKTSRVFEVMLATVKPSDMLAGKLIGVGAVGLTQICIWLVTAAVPVHGHTDCRRAGNDGRHCHSLLMDRGNSVPGVFSAWVLALQLAVCGAGGDVRDGAGVADVYAAGCCAYVAELCHDSADHERFEFGGVGTGVAVSADGADCDVSAHGHDRGSILADRRCRSG